MGRIRQHIYLEIRNAKFRQSELFGNGGDSAMVVISSSDVDISKIAGGILPIYNVFYISRTF